MADAEKKPLSITETIEAYAGGENSRKEKLPKNRGKKR